MRIWQFLKDEQGAVTVDWVTMAAAVTGLSLSSVGAVRSGLIDLGGGIEESLSGASVVPLYDFMGTEFMLAAMGFGDGVFDGWNTLRTGSSEYFGDFLGPFAGNDVSPTFQVDLPSDTETAIITFDLLLLDSWDGTNPAYSDAGSGGRGDGVAFLINGQEIMFSAMTNGSAQNPSGTFELDGVTYAYQMTRTDGGLHYAANGDPASNWADSTWSVEVVVTNPPPGGFQFTVDGTSNQGVADESYGLDNFNVHARRA